MRNYFQSPSTAASCPKCPNVLVTNGERPNVLLQDKIYNIMYQYVIQLTGMATGKLVQKDCIVLTTEKNYC